ncbi:aspartate-semialdehyde dehydrogenase [Gilbertella persicaria]|uniref:aspartate-semialdehyde dehydrogenase n=1 Tax=Gilbertella persicaria TaxID=101096 RepID=UPI00221E99EC|nr:aspartate-semialdehyde dehydrogenase [Gilbertella persicaria]KAI8077978.1 aspartate-semialdehyde dehydrogenase [Gilbertella persicaria]
MAPTKKVGILGATGTVGQRFILLLSEHPIFTIHALGASARSAGKAYKDAVRWKQSRPIPENVAELVVKPCEAKLFNDCDVVFSGLDADVAGDIEMAMLKQDVAVFSNAKNYRRDPNVPLIVPTVNADHFDLIPYQRQLNNLKKGFLITNANCSTTGLVVPLKALQDAFGPMTHILVNTQQAISGAGYPGVPSLDILDNVVPHIGGEEEKMEWEVGKIMGDIAQDKQSFVHLPNTVVSATCTRVPVLDGHLETVSVKFANGSPSIEQVYKVLEEYTSDAEKLGCHSAPEKPIVVTYDADRPQPRLDRENLKGQAVTVGRVRPCPVLDIKFVLLVHNTVLGAAGSSVLNAEIAVAKGLI